MSKGSELYKGRHQVLGYPIDVVDESEALERIEQSWSAGRGMHVVTLNAEMVIQAQQDAELDRIVRHAHLIVPDGAGAVWALRFDGHEAARVPGIDLAHRTLASAARSGRSVSLIGGKPETMDELLQVLPEQHPGLKVLSSHHGYLPAEEEEEIVERLLTERPDLLLVAMGVPRQEYFIDRYQRFMDGTVVIGVGGSFDVWTGRVQRAPELFQRLHLEWFYRLMKEPWRFKRMMSALPSFAWQVISRRFLSGRGSSAGGESSSEERKDAGGRGRHGRRGSSHRGSQDRSSGRSKDS